MKVLLVGGGDLPIPPPEWGGVENLIWQQKTALEEAGHHVEILNKRHRLRRNILRVRAWQYDVVHLHLDRFATTWVPMARLLPINLVVSTHFGYAAFPDKWTTDYRATVQAMTSAKNLLVLSEEMKRVFTDHGCRGTIYALPNGIACDKMRFIEAPVREAAICLGRIELRKKQALMTQALENHTAQCYFAGPVDDLTGFQPNARNTHYLGQWTRSRVHNELTNYACLVLLSDGEGHAGVISEAMAAGLSLVVSPEAAHNLDLSRPWIHVVDRDRGDLGDVIGRAIQDNPQYRMDIRRYCEDNFDWKVILPRYIQILQQIASRK